MTSLSHDRIDGEIKDAFRTAADEAEATIDVNARLAEFTAEPDGGWFLWPSLAKPTSRKAASLAGVAALSAVATVIVVANLISPATPSDPESGQEIAAGEQQSEDVANSSDNLRGRSENGQGNVDQTDFSDSEGPADAAGADSQSATSEDSGGSNPSDDDNSGLSPSDQGDTETTPDSDSDVLLPDAARSTGEGATTGSERSSNTVETSTEEENSTGSQSVTTSTRSRTTQSRSSTISLRTPTTLRTTSATTRRTTSTRRTATSSASNERTTLPRAFRTVPTSPSTIQATPTEVEPATTTVAPTTTERPTTIEPTTTSTTTTTTEPEATTCSFAISGGSINEATATIRAAGCTGTISLIPPDASGSLAQVVGGMSQTIDKDDGITLLGFAQVPDVSGKSPTQANAALRDESFIAVAEPEFVAPDDPRIGTVIDQSPRSQTRQEAQSTVRYTVAVAEPET